MNDCRAVGHSVVESAEFQCDMDLRCRQMIRMNNCPHEIFSELNGVLFELSEVIVEGEARQDGLLVRHISFVFLAFFSLFMLSRFRIDNFFL